jgi:hypothetical protein
MIGIAALAIVVVIFILLPRSDNGSPPNDGASASATASTPTIEPTSTPEPTPEPVAVWTGLTWSDPVTPSFVVHVYDLLPWGDAYVAVGAVEVDATRSEAAFMTSPDGLNWVVTEQHDAGIDRYPRHLVALGDELLAFSNRATTEGLNLGAPPGSAYYGALIWSSTDGGSTWSRIDSPSWEQAWTDARVGLMPDGWDNTQYEITSGLVDVASDADGLVAIGNSYGDNELIPVVLSSADGRTWSPANLPADSPSALLEAVVAFDGGFVIVGAVDAGPRVDTAMAAAWVSEDARSWTGTTVDVVPVDVAPGLGSEFRSVFAGADGLVAWAGVREITVGNPPFTWGSWASPDGLTWSAADAPTDPMAADGVRMVALGPSTGCGCAPPDPNPWPGFSEAWASTNGASWTELTLSSELKDGLEGMWVVPDGLIYAGVQAFWFATATTSP